MSAAEEQAVVAALREGRPAIFPTDTVYGLGVAVDFAPDPLELFRLKGRDASKPVAWLIAEPADLFRFGRDAGPQAAHLAEEGWPGPLTLVVRASDEVPPAYCSAQGTIGLRVPANPLVQRLIAAVGCPLAATSANRSGQAAPSRAGDLDTVLLAQVSALLQDCGPGAGRPSAVIDCSHGDPIRLRD